MENNPRFQEQFTVERTKIRADLEKSVFDVCIYTPENEDGTLKSFN